MKLSATLHAIFFIDCIAVILTYFANVQEQLHLSDTPIYEAFSDPTIIYIGLIVNISSTAVSVVDILLDFYRIYNKSFQEVELEINEEHDSLHERTFLLFLNFATCSTVLILRNNENIPYIYSCAHALQYVGSIGAILKLCHKLDPEHFTAQNIICSQIFFALASVTSMMGFGHGLLYWSNIVNFFFVGGFLCFLFKMVISWLLNLRKRIRTGCELMINDVCCLCYLMSTVLIIIVVPGIVAAIKLFDWSRFTAEDVYVFIFTFTVYGIVICTVPGRLSRFAVDDQQRRVVKIKTAVIRYLGHEVRSPLNIIFSGISFMEKEIMALPPSPEKENIIEYLTSVRQACQDVLQSMNDMLHMETLKSGSFNLQAKAVSCSELVDLIGHCGIIAREKGVSFAVNNRLQSPSVQEDWSLDLEEGGSPSDSKATEMQKDKQHLVMFVDKFKLLQVVRNLITNSVKFTGPEESVTVNIRPAEAADLTEEGSRFGEAEMLAAGYSFWGNAVVEVIDTGVGISPENHGKVFSAFAQFNPNELQVLSFPFLCSLKRRLIL